VYYINRVQLELNGESLTFSIHTVGEKLAKERKKERKKHLEREDEFNDESEQFELFFRFAAFPSFTTKKKKG
jgi:hypothetical protein